jgi:lipid A disaccharide synthetase
VVPELLQEAAAPAALAAHVVALLEPEGAERRAMLAEFAALRAELLRKDAPAEVAAAVRAAVGEASRP